MQVAATQPRGCWPASVHREVRRRDRCGDGDLGGADLRPAGEILAAEPHLACPAGVEVRHPEGRLRTLGTGPADGEGKVERARRVRVGLTYRQVREVDTGHGGL